MVIKTSSIYFAYQQRSNMRYVYNADYDMSPKNRNLVCSKTRSKLVQQRF